MTAEERFDVVVVGAGSAGSSAAISAARAGARTLLIDRLAFMGGTSTAVLDTFYAFYTPGAAPRRVVGGLGWEVVSRLTAGRGRLRAPEHVRRGHRRDLRPGGAQGRLGGAGGRGRAWTCCCTPGPPGVRVRDGRRGGGAAPGTRAANGGSQAAPSSMPPATPTSRAMAGAGYDDAHDPGDVQSLSTLFKLANVDVARASAVPKAELWALHARGGRDGRLPAAAARGLVAPHARTRGS